MESRLEPIDLAGKSILITGGTTGICRATAIRAAASGANVMIFGREQAPLDDALAAMKESAKGKVHGITADQANIEHVQNVFSDLDRQFGGIDILINNAAIGGSDLLETDLNELKYVLDDNLWGYIACTRLALDRMLTKGEGQIVYVGSMSAVDREADGSIYVASKAGIQAFAESIRKQVSEMGIRVTLIEPGLVGTDMTEEPPEKQREEESAGRMLKAEDIADCILYAITQPERVDIISMQVVPRLKML